MSIECENCGEHALECVCNDESLTTIAPFPIGLAAKLISKSIQQTEIKKKE